MIGRAPNYFVLPMAVAQTDGIAEPYVNAFEAASSPLPINEQALRSWIGGDVLKVESIVFVPTIRLDTFMKLMKIDKVDFLKIDTQGTDLSVVKSAGDRLPDIAKITLEVDVAPMRLYFGAPSKDEVVAFLTSLVG
jgi:FkbM family methyltransferase